MGKSRAQPPERSLGEVVLRKRWIEPRTEGRDSDLRYTERAQHDTNLDIFTDAQHPQGSPTILDQRKGSQDMDLVHKPRVGPR